VNRTRRQLMLGFAAACATGSASSPVFACGFDGVFDGGFGFVHPRAIEVALAVRKAVTDGILPGEALSPAVPGAVGLWQSTEQLNRLGRRLSAARTEASTNDSNIALLLSEAALWGRYVAINRGFESLVHVSGPEPTDVVVVSDRAVLSALNAGTLTATDALTRALVIIDQTGPKADAVATLLVAATSGIAASPDRNLEDRTLWSRSARSTRD
jgi:hypothetical protein